MDGQGLLGVLEPVVELCKRIRVELMAFEGCLGVLVGLWGAILSGRGDLRTD